MFSCKFRRPSEYVIGRPMLSTMLIHRGISDDLLWDERYYYVKLENWNKIFFDVLKNMPKYTTKFDCDNFALLVVARIMEKYKLNGCGIAVGKTPMGPHAWNIFIAHPMELLYLEPQTGQIMELNEGGYKAKYVVWG